MSKVMWTEDQIEYLGNVWGITCIKTIAKKLKRTESAIILKAKRIGLGGVRSTGEFLTANGVAKIMGVDLHTVTDYWIAKCSLHGIKKALKKQEIYRIRIEELIKWLEKNKDKWDSRKVEEYSLGVEPEWLKEKRKKDVLLPENKNAKWTKEEDNLLISYTKLGKKQKEIGEILGRSVSSIQHRIKRLKEKGKIYANYSIPWTKEEDKILISMDRKNKTDKEIAWELGREKLNVYSRRKFLIENNKYPGRSKLDLIKKTRVNKILKLKKKGYTNKYIAQKLDIHSVTVYRSLRDFGI